MSFGTQLCINTYKTKIQVNRSDKAQYLRDTHVCSNGYIAPSIMMKTKSITVKKTYVELSLSSLRYI